ncbi:pyruvate formate-lyase-activating protein [Propionivibrio dicarboxylicus]|uniref:Pyruvate formate-lyase-activating enzyme n=1 Tax=Propionivibrio dicarboxylicus TaxID=83767 RepID=A0A1G8G9F7_9RHOO|nr:pyruvate formate-lyase-activating protein [Propionivibrio dicarboxylicus]SDH91035.1 pyruvate formate lyase activating enzyme [Propionivibrio dicarboxylicus]
MRIRTGPRKTQSVDGYIHSLETLGTVDGPGVRFVVFTQGCPHRCLYCHNPDSWRLKHGKRVASAEILDQIENTSTFLQRAKGGVTISGGEPLVQPAFVGSILRGCKEMKLHTALDTTGYLGDKASDAMLADIDLVMLDIKSYDPDTYRRLCGVDLQPTLDFARRLERLGRSIWIRYVVVPGLTDVDEHVAGLADFVASVKTVERVEILPFHKMGEFKWQELRKPYQLTATEPPDAATMARVRQHFTSRGLTVA